MEERRNEEKKTMLDKELYTYTMCLLENRKSVKGVMEMYGTYLAVLFRHFNLPNFVPLTDKYDKYQKRKMCLILTRES